VLNISVTVFATHTKY